MQWQYPSKGVTFNAHFRVYVKFKSRPAGDQTVNFGTVNVLQFDGEGGANMAAKAKNLRYAITGLNNISFLDCSVDVRIFPESQIVNFGQIAMNSISTFAPKAAFSVSTIRDVAANCTEKFDIATNFFTSDTLYDNTHLEMGNGLLMRITDQKRKKILNLTNSNFLALIFQTKCSNSNSQLSCRIKPKPVTLWSMVRSRKT